jgi:hypothetical protein
MLLELGGRVERAAGERGARQRKGKQSEADEKPLHALGSWL